MCLLGSVGIGNKFLQSCSRCLCRDTFPESIQFFFVLSLLESIFCYLWVMLNRCLGSLVQDLLPGERPIPVGLMLKDFVFGYRSVVQFSLFRGLDAGRQRIVVWCQLCCFVLPSQESFQLAASKFQDSPFVTSSGACIQQRIYPWTELRFMLSEVSAFSVFPICKTFTT